MNSTAKNIAAAYLAPKVLKRFKWQYLVFGVAAYYGLKLLSKKGVLPNQTGKALELIDQGIDFAKGQVGLQKPSEKLTPAHLHADVAPLH